MMTLHCKSTRDLYESRFRPLSAPEHVNRSKVQKFHVHFYDIGARFELSTTVLKPITGKAEQNVTTHRRDTVKPL